MLAPKELDPRFKQWNRSWGAPFGNAPRPKKDGTPPVREPGDEFDQKGIFGFQGNNDTRRFEYPWAYHAVDIRRGMNVLEVGGGMSGFQFVLAKSGAKVVNVDPGMDDIGGHVTKDFIARANAKLGTNVTLLKEYIANASLQDGTFDVAYSVSVIEHIPVSHIDESMARIGRLLAAGGRLVMTVDLFLDLQPFSRKLENRFGTNMSIRRLVEASGLQLELGDPHQLYGFDEFDPQRVMEKLPDLLIGTGYPTLVQCAVLRKPS